MPQSILNVVGRVLDRAKLHGVAGLRVEAQSADAKASALTDQQGIFTITFDESRHPDLFKDKSAEVIFTFDIFAGETLLKTTQEAVLRDNRGSKFAIDIVLDPPDIKAELVVKGTIRASDGKPSARSIVRAFDRDLRHEEQLGESATDGAGRYEISYSAKHFRRREKGNADLVVKVISTDGSTLVASPVLFNAPPTAEIDLIIPDNAQLSALFERIGQALEPLLEGLRVAELEEDAQHQDVSFLSADTGFDKITLARFVIAHKLAQQANIETEFWFALLGGSFFQLAEDQTLQEQLADIPDSLSSLDDSVVRKALIASINRNEIPDPLRGQVDDWIEAFAKFTSRGLISEAAKPTLVKSALEDAGIKSVAKQEAFARLFNQYKQLTPALLDELEKDGTFSQAEIADLRASFQLSELTNADFSVVKIIKSEFNVRQPERIRSLAKISKDEWVKLVKAKHAAGEISLPSQAANLPAQMSFPEAEAFAETLERRFREAFPTAAFTGGLERALNNGGARGLRNAKSLGAFLETHEDFELLTTTVDEFLANNTNQKSRAIATNEDFRLELKAVQRVFKLAPTFEATDALLADDLHSAHKVYRMGETEFAQRYGSQPGFTPETARLAWNRAADTHAAVLTIVADLKALDPETLPLALNSGSKALATFPNWNNLFQSGDTCECEQCHSVLSPAAYFADLLMFLKDRKAANSSQTVKDILFNRRSDIGYIELNCENANTPLPYVDVVNEVLERVIAEGENDLELTGFSAIPSGALAAKTAVAAAFSVNGISLGTDFSLSQVKPSDPDLWVAHGDEVTYLLMKKTTANFFAQILPNTKVSAAELRAYPQYVNPKAYEVLRQARYPFALPFDLFAEEVRVTFQKMNIQRWELMRALRKAVTPNSPTDSDIAAEYFGISVNPSAVIDEKRIILTAAPTDAEQQVFWGETAIPGNLSNVKLFLQKTGLDFNELLALLDLKFINPAGDIFIDRPDPSCDTDKMILQNLDAAKLDRIHRFLRLCGKLKGWKKWEADLVLRMTLIGDESLDETFLVNLMGFVEVKNRLGRKVTVEQAAALFGDLNVHSHFTHAYEKREEGIYQKLFLNRRLTNPTDPQFEIDPGTGDLANPQPITGNHGAIAAALGIREADIVRLKEMTKASDGTPYILDNLSLGTISFLWRHAWLAKQLNFKVEEWVIALKVLRQDILEFIDPATAIDFLERVDHLKACGFGIDEMNWLLTADRSAKAAMKESDAARFLTGLRKELQVIRAEYGSAQYDFLTVIPATDVDRLSALLTSLLQKLNRDEQATQSFIDTLRNEVTLGTTVTGLPAGFQDFPITIKSAIRISYAKAQATIRFTGLMTEAEKTILLTDSSLPVAVVNNTDYQAAIDELFTTPRLALKFFEPVFSAPLENLPGAIDFKAQLPSALALKIVYDAEQRALRFAGIMSKDEKELLEALDSGVAYQNAVNSLFAQPTISSFPPEAIWIENADLQFPLRDLVTPANDHLAENLAYAVTIALAYLSKTLSERAVIQQVSAQLGLTEALTGKLLTGYPLLPETLLAHLTGAFAATTDALDYSAQKATFDGWFWANRAAIILKKWKITFEELERLVALIAGTQVLDLQLLPLDDAGGVPPIEMFLLNSRLLRLRDSLPESDLTFLELLEKLITGAYSTPADFASDAQLVNPAWPAADVEALILPNAGYAGDYMLVENWERLHRTFYFLNSLNADANALIPFAAAAMKPAHTKALKELLRSKLGAEAWLALSAEIQDALRNRKRNALTACLLAQPEPVDTPTGKWENTNDLYAYYLLDVEMSACQLTSRLVQASGAVQLLTQRCFMGLEPEVVVKADGPDGDSAWRWWKWMRKYRVWEANRKVFLWPENWIAPELKQDRSPFFREMESELLQNEINQQTVEAAFLNYLDKLDGVAQLEIAGFYQEDDGDNSIVHVFGRTIGAEPHFYYYRRFDYRQWTPWEKVDLDIYGEYLIPAVINRRLFLFWPVFTEAQDELGNSKVVTPDTSKSHLPLAQAKKKLKLQLAVSEYRQGKWTPKRISKDAYESSPYEGEIIKNKYGFRAVDRSRIDGRFEIQFEGYSEYKLPADREPLPARMSGIFELVGCGGVPELVPRPTNKFAHVIRPEHPSTGIKTISSKWVELSSRTDAPENDLTFENYLLVQLNPAAMTPVLMQTPGIFKVSPPWQLSYMDRLWFNGQMTDGSGAINDPLYVGTWLPYFYKDKKRTFFVLPSPSSSGERLRVYYPELKKGFRQSEDYFNGLAEQWASGLNLALLSLQQRQQLETDLRQQFPEETLPPYTDDQIKNLMKRLITRYYDYNLGAWSFHLFQFRQFHFENFYHPFTCDFASLAYDPLQGIPGLMSRATQLKDSGFSFRQTYQPTQWVIEPPTENFYPKEVVDFSPDGAYSSYNWELFFHAPLLIANSLNKNQRFEEARDWYHFIFNPIGVESATPGGSPMSKNWITKPFYLTADTQYIQQRIENILRMLAGDNTVPGFSAQSQKDIEDQVLDWRTKPFDPHRIASYRIVAYQKTAVMNYLDNLISWGDYLFGQDSMESINEATQLYVLAAEILGPRPMKIPPRVKTPLESFNELENQFDEFSNAMVQVENLIPVMPGTGQSGINTPPLPTLYFCIPQNEKLLGYWDTVADRLYKIRHCMNIEGVTRQLALFEPPIDPGALVKAIAGGADISSAFADLSAPLPLYRFNVLSQKANEVCNDVKALGGALLSALEKKDAEALGLLRQSHETRLLEAMTAVREKQIEEAKANLESLKRTRIVIETKRDYYRNIVKIAPGEQLSIDKQKTAFEHQNRAQQINIAASNLGYLPSITAGVSGGGGSPHATVQWGTGNIISALQAAAGAETQMSSAASFEASQASTITGYERRYDDWKLQEKLADREIDQTEKQIAATELRIAIAEKELENHLLQIKNAKATDDFMRSKYTNEELYQWQVGQISGAYFQSYKLAYDLAKRAERCFRFELGVQDSSYINFGYWDSLKKGLLSGEKLQYDLRRLETAYVEQNRREFELTKHASLALLDPLALVKLRETGRCFFSLPEELFDMDFPGHYFRRIKSVSVTLPCVAGPYTTISCTLRLLKSSTRISTQVVNGYQRNTDDQNLPSDDERFVESNIPVKAIAACNAQNDSGVFELSFRDERYLPFEGAGAISGWSLELFNDLPSNNPDPAKPDFGKPLRQFDYSTITDALIHVKYTAREDAGQFKNKAIAHLRDYFYQLQDGPTPSFRLINLRQEFPTEWHRFLNPAGTAGENIFELEMSPTLFPSRDEGKTLNVESISLFARGTDPTSYKAKIDPAKPALPLIEFTLLKHEEYGGLYYREQKVSGLGIEIAPTTQSAKWMLTMTRSNEGSLQQGEIEDLLLVLGYNWE